MGNALFSFGSRLLDITGHGPKRSNKDDPANESDGDDIDCDERTVTKVEEMESYCKPLIFVKFYGQTSSDQASLTRLFHSRKSNSVLHSYLKYFQTNFHPVSLFYHIGYRHECLQRYRKLGCVSAEIGRNDSSNTCCGLCQYIQFPDQRVSRSALQDCRQAAS